MHYNVLSNTFITVLSTMSNTKARLRQLHAEQKVSSVSLMQAVIPTRKFLGKV